MEKLNFLKKWQYALPLSIHLIPIILLSIVTLLNIKTEFILMYSLLSVLFLICTSISLFTILELKKGTFYYLLNLMFLLGFLFKYSVQKITGLNYQEPIGNFIINSTSEKNVLLAISFAITGFIISQIVLIYFFPTKKESQKSFPEDKNFYLSLFSIIVLTTVLSVINLKYNILLFALKPSLILPFKGNAIFFLAITRATFFLFFFYCTKKFSNQMIFWGSIVALIASIGVLSRMFMLVYFSVIFIYILQNISNWNFKAILSKTLNCIIIFGIFSYLTVLLGTGFREYFVQKSNQVQVVQISNKTSAPTFNSHFELKDKFKLLIEMALGRWIGIEGVMAVESYPNKSFHLLWEGLNEKSYHGNSFYTQIATPEIFNNQNSGQVITTSVPGPVAFFYYPGSYIFLAFAIFASTFLLSLIEIVVQSFYKNSQMIVIFVSTFIVFDFFQFGISPIAYLRYLSFSVFCVLAFYFGNKYYLERFKKL